MSVCAKIIQVMADYIMLRKGRNALSSITHIVLNIALAVASTALTVISGNWVFGVLLVFLSKWRVIAVRPRYWWLNIKANLVDFTVGISLALLVYMASAMSSVEGLNGWHIALTIIYAVWLTVIKPQSVEKMTELQAFFAIFFGCMATSLMTSNLNPIVGCVCCFIIGYGASRHVLTQGDDHDFVLTTFIFGLVLAELSWIFYHWTIVYYMAGLNWTLYHGAIVSNLDKAVTFAIPQLPIAATLTAFVFTCGYKSALLHDGKIRVDDIMLPAIFSALLMFVMVFFYSNASFNV